MFELTSCKHLIVSGLVRTLDIYVYIQIPALFSRSSTFVQGRQPSWIKPGSPFDIPYHPHCP